MEATDDLWTLMNQSFNKCSAVVLQVWSMKEFPSSEKDLGSAPNKIYISCIYVNLMALRQQSNLIYVSVL